MGSNVGQLSKGPAGLCTAFRTLSNSQSQGWVHSLQGPVHSEYVGPLVLQAEKKLFPFFAVSLLTCHSVSYFLFNVSCPGAHGYLQGEYRPSQTLPLLPVWLGTWVTRTLASPIPAPPLAVGGSKVWALQWGRQGSRRGQDCGWAETPTVHSTNSVPLSCKTPPAKHRFKDQISTF